MDKKTIERKKEDLEFSKGTREAWERYDKGEFIEMDSDEFLKELEKWAKEE